jgi:hypothetical protein
VPGGPETYEVISLQDLSNISRRILVELLVVSEDYDCDIHRAEDGKLMRLLEQSTFAFQESAVEVHVSVIRTFGDVSTTYTERFLSSLMALISIFRRPMMNATRQSRVLGVDSEAWSDGTPC